MVFENDIDMINYLLHKYMWVYERENGDRGFVLASSYDEAVEKLSKRYPDAEERIKRTEEDCCLENWMYLYDITRITIDNDIYVVDPY